MRIEFRTVPRRGPGNTIVPPTKHRRTTAYTRLVRDADGPVVDGRTLVVLESMVAGSDRTPGGRFRRRTVTSGRSNGSRGDTCGVLVRRVRGFDVPPSTLWYCCPLARYPPLCLSDCCPIVGSRAEVSVLEPPLSRDRSSGAPARRAFPIETGIARWTGRDRAVAGTAPGGHDGSRECWKWSHRRPGRGWGSGWSRSNCGGVVCRLALLGDREVGRDPAALVARLHEDVLATVRLVDGDGNCRSGWGSLQAGRGPPVRFYHGRGLGYPLIRVPSSAGMTR